MRDIYQPEIRVCRTCQPARSAAASTLAGTCKRNALVPWLICISLCANSAAGACMHP